MNADIVVGLQFGDEGKGLMTDNLASVRPNESIVVRYCGGQQAGHTVIRNGIKHVHSNFGSGSLLGVPTYFSEHTTFYLPTIVRELEVLQGNGVAPKLYIHPLAKVTTPYDVAYGRLREEKLAHGSVGLGIGTTMMRQNTTGYKLHAIDLTNPSVFFIKYAAIRRYYLDLLRGDQIMINKFNEYLELFEQPFIDAVARYEEYIEIKSYDFLRRYVNIIFEGAQGVMLDMDHGFFPHVTYSNTTSKNAIEICEKLNIRPRIYYITRCYQTRHGNGPMTSTEFIHNLTNTDEEINVQNQWQGSFKIRELDYDLLNYALDIDNIYSSGLSKSIVVTCLDQRIGFDFEYGKLNTDFVKIFESFAPSADGIEEKYSNILSLNSNK